MFDGHVIMIKVFPYLVTTCFLVLSVADASGQNKRGIRSVDFRNFSYESDGREVVLRDGKFSEGDDASWLAYKLDDVKYVDFDGDGIEEAFVIVDFRTSGTSDNAKDYYVFAYRGGKPRVIFHEWREKPRGVRVNGRSLIIAAPFWRDGGLCCPSGVETSIYRWRGARFVRVSRKRQYIDPNTKWWLTTPRLTTH
jgi:hypothetical protein